mgnify:CR=1 FL=1
MDIRFSEFLNDSIDSNLNIANIALLANSQAYLSTNGVFFENSIEYFGTQGHQDVLESSNLIIKQLEGDWYYVDNFGIQHAYEKTLFFYLRLYLHYWLMYLYIVSQAIKKHSPKCIYIDKYSSLNNLGTSISDNNRIFGNLVRQYVESNNLDIKIVEEYEINHKYRFSKRNSFMVKHLFNAFMSTAIAIYRPFVKNKKVLLVADDSYNMLSLIDKIKAKDPKVFPIYINISRGKFWQHLKNLLTGKEMFFSQNFDAGDVSSSLNNLLLGFSSKVKKHKNIEIFNFFGVDLRDILSAYVAKSSIGEMALLENSIKKMHGIFDAQKPYFALSQHALGYSYALGEMCSIENIPSLLITHGTHTLQKEDKYAQIEWGEHAKTIINARFSHSAIQSPIADEFFNSLDDKYSTGLKTGPLIYSRLKRDKSLFKLKEWLIGKMHVDKKIIIHAGTPKGNSAIRPWVYETIDEYVRNINDLIDVVDSLKDVYLIVRFRPSEGLNKADFSKLVNPSDNYGIYSDGPFDDYLAASDLLVSYSSTTIEEALQNDVVVLQYDHDDKYMHIQAPVIIEGQKLDANPIYYCGNKSELKNSINVILKNIDLIKSEKHKWDLYQYPVDDKLEWLDKLLSK